MAKGGLSAGDIPMLEGFLYHRGTVVTDFGYDTYVFEAGEGVVYEEMLGKVGMEGGEIIVLSRNAGGSSRVSMEDFSIDPL